MTLSGLEETEDGEESGAFAGLPEPSPQAEKEKAAKAAEYKHMTFYEAAQIAADAQVGEMWLTHYSPSMLHPKQYLEEVRKIFPNTKCGKDGMQTELLYED